MSTFTRAYTQDKSTMFSHLHAHVLLGTWLKHLFTEENLEMDGFFHREDQPIAGYKCCSHDLIRFPGCVPVSGPKFDDYSLAGQTDQSDWCGKNSGFNSFFEVL